MAQRDDISARTEDALERSEHALYHAAYAVELLLIDEMLIEQSRSLIMEARARLAHIEASGAPGSRGPDGALD